MSQESGREFSGPAVDEVWVSRAKIFVGFADGYPRSPFCAPSTMTPRGGKLLFRESGLQLLREKKTTSFQELALPHIDAVYRFSLHLAGNEADAEDLSQECFHQAFRKFHQFQRGTNCRAWLFRIARNAFIDRLRKKNREPPALELQEAAAVSADQRNSDETTGALEISAERQTATTAEPGSLEDWKSLAVDDETIFCDMFGDEVNRFLQELPSEFRLAVVLCDVEGFAYHEIGEVFGCPIGTVRSRIARARAHLKTRLYDYAKSLGFVRNEK